ncbi:QacE family quaternary ammonium compound efflux SMR transporter [Pseudonocardia sp. KRD-184]|uniref:QacE family quaternary ammonium compound efflux SMR transporter n=1 Tax=Pseudonocardia oceani TaxID=2792013 RepID=A0ABS6UI18_9PSEU|nr:SMR family transporter [Pseudonocardia oceani]MBW0092618.1 QacE family quaternary ammonium compound efflux SMR transporter [Pseudonocardia oceani]MBW0099461.1 QacE family quaternary ammonium compound efflux SMR transporter [Pseudonocardia oceani]MBW0109203.1 QacE family quaternary ammonium compound efflux SMR transporter [Pseudonocardia oceani]MBW0123017.1 QacE family quaternary ammonium compound efflux SMR transporter [Pseudonocardia oceani]MBW0131868.1 QacE family quaternary ammonium comp
MVFGLLVLAVVSGVVGSTSLKLSRGFRRFWPVVGTALGYGVATVALGLLMEHLPVGVIHAVWGGGAAVLLTVVGRTVFGERITAARLAGVGLIVGGVVLLNLTGTL